MALPKKMQGVIPNGHGGPGMLEWRDDLAVPVPGKGDVIIQVAAAGVNNTDTRTAWYSKGDADADDAAWSGTALVFHVPRELMLAAQSLPLAMMLKAPGSASGY